MVSIERIHIMPLKEAMEKDSAFEKQLILNFLAEKIEKIQHPSMSKDD